MEVITSLNFKGGVGKTTIVANMAAELAQQGNRVLVIDLDSQASLTFSFMDFDKWKVELRDKWTINEWFDSILSTGRVKKIDDFIFSPHLVNAKLSELHSSDKVGLDLIPSSPAMRSIDIRISPHFSNPNTKNGKKKYLKFHSILRYLKRSKVFQSYDYVFLDCPPEFTMLSKNAIIASDYIIIPSRADYISTIGIDELYYNFKKLIDKYNSIISPQEYDNSLTPVSPKILGVVFSMLTRNRKGDWIHAALEQIHEVELKGRPVFETKIGFSNALAAAAPISSLPIVMLPSQGEVAVKLQNEYKDLANELVMKIEEDK